jgi:hypothetical protein
MGDTIARRDIAEAKLGGALAQLQTTRARRRYVVIRRTTEPPPPNNHAHCKHQLDAQWTITVAQRAPIAQSKNRMG